MARVLRLLFAFLYFSPARNAQAQSFPPAHPPRTGCNNLPLVTDTCGCSALAAYPPCPTSMQLLGQELKRTVSDAPKSFNSWERQGWMLLNLIPIVLFIFICIRYEYVWMKYLAKREQIWADQVEGSENPVMNLAQMIIPALGVKNYVFKGIEKPRQGISLRFQDLGLRLKDGQQVLAGVTGEFPAGKLIAAMGPSGAGKTTFLNVLCGKATYGQMTGHVFVNDEERPIRDFNPIIGFVPQDDIVYEKLRVRESLFFSAKLRNSRDIPHSQIQYIVDDVLTVLSIGHIQRSIVGGVEERGISGGQRKRVNIGLELVASPTLLFLDEPTSGLDATSSLTIIRSLKKMTEFGMTVIMVIHQPRYSLFKLFDSVLLLAKGGRTVYLGEAEHAKSYFTHIGFAMPSNENPADWFMDIISGEVKNEVHMDFHPRQLSGMWNEHKGSWSEEQADIQRDSESCFDRVTALSDDLLLIQNAIEEAWSAISAGNAIDFDQFTKLIRYSITGETSDDVVQQFWNELRANRHVEVVTMDMIVGFMASLLLAKDEPASRPSTGSADSRHYEDRAMDAMDGAVDVAADVAIAAADAVVAAADAFTAAADAITPTAMRVTTFGRGFSSRSHITKKGSTVSTDVTASPEAAASTVLRRAATATSEVESQHVPVPNVLAPPKAASSRGSTSKSSFSSNRSSARVLRIIPGHCRQFGIICKRRLIQVFRNVTRRIVDLIVIVAFAVLLGIQHKGKTSHPGNVVLFHMALSILVCVKCLPCFGAERTMFWRERSHNLSGVAYCTARMLVDMLDTFTQTTVYATVYYWATNPPVKFSLVVAPCYLIMIVCSGWGYFISVSLPPTNAVLMATVLMIVMNGALGDPNRMTDYIDGGFMEFVVGLCPTRWTVQMIVIEWWKHLNKELVFHAPPEVLGLANVYRSSMYDKGQAFTRLSREDAMKQSRLADLGDKHWGTSTTVLILQAIALRIVAILILCYKDRDKQV